MLMFNYRGKIVKKEGTRFMLVVELVLEVTGLWQLLNCCRESKSSTISCLNASQSAPLLNVIKLWCRVVMVTIQGVCVCYIDVCDVYSSCIS